MPQEYTRREFFKNTLRLGGSLSILGLFIMKCDSINILQRLIQGSALEELLKLGAPTATKPTATKTSISPIEKTVENSSFFQISGVPEFIDHNNLLKWTERPPAPGDADHINTIGLGTQGWLSERGVLTADTKEEADKNPSCWYAKDADVQTVFTHQPPAFWSAPEGGFAMFTGAAMTLTFDSIDGRPINVRLGAEENHGWIVIVRGLSRDYKTPADRNNQIRIDDYNPGFTMGTRLPPGQYVSLEYVLANVRDVHTKNCGADGCQRVSVLCIDPQGAYTVIQQNGLNGQWTQYATNIK